MTVAKVRNNKNDYYTPDFLGGVLDSFFNGEVSRSSKSSVAVNVLESNAAFQIQFSLAGFSKEDVEISVEDSVLNVKGKKEGSESNENKVLRKEFSLSDFERAFNLPETINIEAVNAEFDNGILTIELPKKEPVKPVSVKIDVK